MNLSGQNTHATSLLDLLLSLTAEKLGLHDDGLRRQTTLAQNLENTLQK